MERQFSSAQMSIPAMQPLYSRPAQGNYPTYFPYEECAGPYFHRKEELQNEINYSEHAAGPDLQDIYLNLEGRKVIDIRAPKLYFAKQIAAYMQAYFKAAEEEYLMKDSDNTFPLSDCSKYRCNPPFAAVCNRLLACCRAENAPEVAGYGYGGVLITNPEDYDIEALREYIEAAADFGIPVFVYIKDDLEFQTAMDLSELMMDCFDSPQIMVGRPVPEYGQRLIYNRAKKLGITIPETVNLLKVNFMLHLLRGKDYSECDVDTMLRESIRRHGSIRTTGDFCLGSHIFTDDGKVEPVLAGAAPECSEEPLSSEELAFNLEGQGFEDVEVIDVLRDENGNFYEKATGNLIVFDELEGSCFGRHDGSEEDIPF